MRIPSSIIPSLKNTGKVYEVPYNHSVTDVQKVDLRAADVYIDSIHDHETRKSYVALGPKAQELSSGRENLSVISNIMGIAIPKPSWLKTKNRG